MQGTRQQWYTRGLTLLLALTILGCSEDTGPEPLTGTWMGTLQDSLGGRGTLRLEVSQTNRQLTGTWQRTFADAQHNSGGTLSGTGPAQDLLITMVWSTTQSGACSFTVSAMLDNNDEDHFTGTYTPFDCAQPTSGSLNVHR